MELIERFIQLEGAQQVHIIVAGQGGKAEMILPLVSSEGTQVSAEPIVDVVALDENGQPVE